jgi:hypothetical protein
MPAIDAAMCSGWTEQDTNLYQAMPYYLAKIQVDRRKTYGIWSKYTKKRKWKPNMGPILRGVRAEPSPHMRQFAFPNRLCAAPKKDVVDIREVTTEAEVYRHRFESPVFNFCPSFVDFMNHIDEHGKDIMEKIERFEDLFIRGNIFHMSPYMFVCEDDGDGDANVRLVATAPWRGTGTFDSAVHGKTAAVLAANAPTATLTLQALSQIFTIMENDLRIPFFSGADNGASVQDNFLAGKYLTILSSEKYIQFTFDPWVLANKTDSYDVVNNGFHGSFFGRGTSRLEDLPLRSTTEGVFHQPEVRVDDSDGITYNDGETLLNDNYGNPAVSQVEYGFVMGPSGYESIEVGPPPSQFTGDTFPNAPKMFWNGEVKLTKHILTPCVDADTGDTIYEANTYGDYIKFISQATFGILPVQRRNVIPIAYLRKRGK